MNMIRRAPAVKLPPYTEKDRERLREEVQRRFEQATKIPASMVRVAIAPKDGSFWICIPLPDIDPVPDGFYPQVLQVFEDLVVASSAHLQLMPLDRRN